jgi:hypothetical protein
MSDKKALLLYCPFPAAWRQKETWAAFLLGSFLCLLLNANLITPHCFEPLSSQRALEIIDLAAQ